MKIYQTKNVKWGVEPIINEIEVDRVSDVSVWIKGRRRNKVSDYEKFHDTWEDAYKSLVSSAANRLERKQKEFQIARRELKAVKNMKAPI